MMTRPKLRRLAAGLFAILILAILAIYAPLLAQSNDDAQLPKDLSQTYLLERYATPKSNFAYLNGTMLHYRDEGEGPVVLLIHGSMQDLYDWDEWTEDLKSDYRVVRIDMPGAGLTGEVASKDYSIASTMNTVDALMAKLDVQEFALVGTSLGGVVAFRYASTRPQKVAALILMNSAGVEYGNAKILPPQPRRYDESLSDTLSRKQVSTLIEAVCVDPDKVSASRIDRGFVYQRRLHRHEEAQAIVSAYDRGQPEVVIGQIKAPTLVLWGGANRALAPEVADEFVSLLTHASPVEKIVVPGAGHWMHVESPRDSLEPVRDFLARHFAGRSP